MPSRPNIGVPQHCVGCDRAFCGAYWVAQGVDTSDFNTICSPETFKPISGHTVTRIPDITHQNNLHEIDITEKCIQQTGKTLQAVISDWIIKFENREIDRTRLQINHAETITERTHICNFFHQKHLNGKIVGTATCVAPNTTMLIMLGKGTMFAVQHESQQIPEAKFLFLLLPFSKLPPGIHEIRLILGDGAVGMVSGTHYVV